MEENIINSVIDNFDYVYILMVNIITYGLIKIFDSLNGPKPVSILAKRIITVISIIIMFCVYYFNDYENIIKLINSSIAAPLIWSWILRPVIMKLNLGYKQNDISKE